MTTYAYRDCPACNSPSSSARPIISAEKPAENLTFDELIPYWRGFRKDSLFFSYSRCNSCGLLYCPIYFTNDQLSTLYSTMDDNTAGEEKGTLVRTQRGYIRAIDATALAGNWLDLGADIGLCSYELRRTPSVARVDAVEPNLSVHRQLRDALGLSGSIYLDLGDTSEKDYDGIVAVHVLDHLKELGSEIDRIRDRLRGAGVLTAVVHNESSLLRRLLGKRWPPFCLQHPQIFRPDSLSAALESRGLKVLGVERTTNWFALRHIVAVVLSITGMPKSLSKIFPNLPLPVKLGNIQVVAQLRN